MGNLARKTKTGTLKMQDGKMLDLEFRKQENLLSVCQTHVRQSWRRSVQHPMESKQSPGNVATRPCLKQHAPCRDGRAKVEAGLRYRGKGGCECDAPVRAVPARRAGTTCYSNTSYYLYDIHVGKLVSTTKCCMFSKW